MTAYALIGKYEACKTTATTGLALALVAVLFTGGASADTSVAVPDQSDGVSSVGVGAPGHEPTSVDAPGVDSVEPCGLEPCDEHTTVESTELFSTDPVPSQDIDVPPVHNCADAPGQPGIVCLDTDGSTYATPEVAGQSVSTPLVDAPAACQLDSRACAATPAVPGGHLADVPGWDAFEVLQPMNATLHTSDVHAGVGEGEDQSYGPYEHDVDVPGSGPATLTLCMTPCTAPGAPDVYYGGYARLESDLDR